MKKIYVFVYILLMFLISITLASAEYTYLNLTAHRWTFDDADIDGNNATDVLNERDAVIQTNVMTGKGGFLEEAFCFNGSFAADNLLVFPGSAQLNVTDWDGNFTLSAWLNITSTTNSLFFEFANIEYMYIGMQWECSANNIAFMQSDGTFGCAETTDYVFNVWQHYTFVRNQDAESIAIYINGSLKDSTTGLDVLIDKNLANSVNRNANTVNFCIDDIVLWDRTLTATEIMDLYNNYTEGGTANDPFSALSPPVDTSAPLITNLSTNATNLTGQYETINLIANCTDETAAGQIWYSKYNGTDYFNSTSYNYVNNLYYMFNITINEKKDTAVNFTVYCNDSSGNINNTAGWLGFNVSGDRTAPVITFVYPVQEKKYNNYDGWLNFTTNENATCEVNASWVHNSSNTTYFFYWNTNYLNLIDGIHLVNVSCWDTENNNGSNILNFSIDITKPVIVTNIDYNTTFLLLGSNLTVQANLTDNIKLYELNVTTPEGFENYTGNINASTYTWNNDFNLSTYSTGKHNITFEVCDAHTAALISDFDYTTDQTNKKITYNFGDISYSIEAKDKTHFITVETYKDIDKYVFEFNKAKGYETNEETYIVKSNSFIDIIGDEKFTGWLVIPKLKIWVDFETPEDYKATVTRISNNEVQVTTRGFDFKSTGGLNCINHTAIYHLFNYTLDYQELTTEDELVTFVLNIEGITMSYLNNSNINATLIYNNTEYMPNKLNGSKNVNFTVDLITPLIDLTTKGIPFYWNYTLNGINKYNTTTQNQTVSQFILDNCTIGTNVTLTMDIYDEETPNNKLNARVEMAVDYFVNNETKNISYSFEGANHYNICLYPADASIIANMYLKYNTSNGFTHRYYIVNETFTNVTKNISMYNYKTTTGISDLEGTIREKTTYQYLTNIVTKMQRYYPAENVWRTVQMDESGDFGLVFFNIKEQNTDYRFIFMDRQNHILKTTDSMKFVCTSAVCDLTFLINEWTGAAQATNVTILYSYNNATGDINITWNDPTGLTQTFRVLVTKETMTGTITICDTTVSAASGVIGCNIAAYTGTILVRVFTAASPELPQFFKWIDIKVGKLSTVISNTEGAFWSFGIMLSIIGFGIMTGAIGAIIAMLFGLIILSFLDLFTVITISLITVACVIGIIIGIKVRG